MKSLALIFAILVFTIASCTQQAKKSENKAESSIATDTSTSITKGVRDDNDSNLKKKNINIKLGVNYAFSNDTLCETLYLKEIKRDKGGDEPKELEFRLVLHDKTQQDSDKIFTGVAKMTSPTESFSDNSDPDGGDYDAADYTFYDGSKNNILIKLDVNAFEACAIIFNSKQPDIFLGRFEAYVKNTLGDGVLKVGGCK